MRLRLPVLTVSALLLLVLIGLPTAQAQTNAFGERDPFWRTAARVNMPVTLCHIPPGNPGNAHTIEVGQAAVPAHLAHGDTLGECVGECPPYPAPVAATGQGYSWSPGDDGDHKAGVAVESRFTDSLDGTVRDELTGLIWLKHADCFSVRQWLDALSDANTLTDGSCGLTDDSAAGDWRLPNLRELQSLIDYAAAFPALRYGHPFDWVEPVYPYWSSTSTAIGTPRTAWVVSFFLGHASSETFLTHPYHVWPVRGPE